MFRQGIRRCAGLAGSAASVSTLLRSRATLATAAPLCRPHGPLKLRGAAHVIRSYSSEAVAREREKTEAPAPGEITKFSDLASSVNANLLRAITQGMGYDDMTPVQAKTIVPSLKGTDIVAQAKTGTGKTLAFLLPLMQRMINDDPSLAKKQASYCARSDDIRGIVLSPTRELAEQIATEARRLVQHTGLVVQCAVGGTLKSAMLRQTQREGCHLLVATPGRLNDLLQDPRSGIAAPNLSAFVLDEADRMLDVGFEKELNEIIRCLPSTNDKVRQTMLVSATIPDDVIRLARTMVRPQDFEFVQTIAENDSLTHEKVPQYVVPISSWANVFPSLFEFFDRELAKSQSSPDPRPFKAIVYFNTTAMVELSSELGFHRRRNNMMKVSTFSIHSQLSQMQRTNAAERFRNAKSAILFSSDVTARGMDFPDVTHVIQVDTPRDRESYIHRIGRTGRQNKEGEGWLFLPSLSVNSAKRLLNNLPLKHNDSLESANVDIKAGDLPTYHKQVSDTMGSVPKRMYVGAYMSLFGGGQHSRERLVEDLNDWTVHGLGWSAPPTVSMLWAQKQGLLNCGLNIQERGSQDDDQFGDGGRPRRFGSSRSEGGESSDPFADLGRRVRRDDGGDYRRGSGFGGGRGFGGGDGRGFGGGRGRGGYGRGGSDRGDRGGSGRSW